MFEVLDALYIGAMIHIKNFFTDEKGAVDLVAIVVLIGIAIALAVVFRTQIEKILNDLFESIGKNAKEATKTSK